MAPALILDPATPPSIRRSESPPSRFYRPELDALRFFAFLAVFLMHAMPSSLAAYTDKLHLPQPLAAFVFDATHAGRGGVVLFFMLSSYLITSLLIREYEKLGTINLRSFYARRALRIWPLYYVFLSLCVFFPLLRGTPIPTDHLVGLTTFTENWMIFFRGWIGFTTSHLWSVSVEEQFYFVWPLLLCVFGISRIKSLSIVCIIAAQYSRVWIIHRGGYDEYQLWRSTFSHIDSIAVGSLLADLFRHGVPRFKSPVRLTFLVSGILLPILAERFVEFANLRVQWGETIRYPMVTAGCALVLLAVLGWDCGQGIITRIVIYLGKISYGLYLLHAVSIVLVSAFFRTAFITAPLSFLGTVVLAAASYRYLETPFLRLKNRFSVIESRKI